MYGERFRALVMRPGRDALEQFYASDALLDANVPLWRFQVIGIEAIADQYAEWFAEGPAEVDELNTWEAPWGAVVETFQRQTDQGVRVASRNLHVFFVEGERVVRHVMYCTGMWDAATEARHKDEALMYDS